MRLKILLFLLTSCFLCRMSFAQTVHSPINIGTKSEPFVAQYSIPSEVGAQIYCYRFTITTAMNITISHCGSTVPATGIFLCDNIGDYVDTSVSGNCDNPSLAELFVPNLAAGTYDIQFDCTGPGYVQTTINGDRPDIIGNATEVGNYSSSSSYTDVKDTSDPGIAFQGGRFDGGVCYKFALSQNMDVAISHCGSALSDTRIYLLDSSGEYLVESKTGNVCHDFNHAQLNISELPIGTYYVVSVGEHSIRGSITTNIMFSDIHLGIGTASQNFVVERTFTSAEGNTWQDKITYFDEMGRPEQTVLSGASPSKNDIASLFEYDTFGRKQKSWLQSEVEGNGGAYIQPNILKNKVQASNCNDSNPYSLIEYELSPLNRPVREYGAGQDWYSKGRFSSIGYLINIQGDVNLNCIQYKAEFADTTATIKNTGNYPTGSLVVNRSIDEDGHTVIYLRIVWEI